MKDKINSELQKLQEELSTLDSAAKQIKKAGEVSEIVVLGAKEIQVKYSEQLDKILQLYSEYLNKSYRHSEENVKKLYEFIQEKIKDEESILEKYTELTIKTEDLTHEYIKKVVSENKATLDAVANGAKEQIESQKILLEEYFKSSEANLNGVLSAHKEEISKVDELLTGYLELAQSTASLTQVLDSVDFPKKLEDISALISNNKDTLDKNKEALDKNKEGIDKNNYIISAINKLQGENGQKLQQLIDNKTNSFILKIVENQQKKVKSTNRIAWIILILNLIAWGSMAFVFFHFFPDFFEALLN
jgi:hypothetical protein